MHHKFLHTPSKDHYNHLALQADTPAVVKGLEKVAAAQKSKTAVLTSPPAAPGKKSLRNIAIAAAAQASAQAAGGATDITAGRGADAAGRGAGAAGRGGGRGGAGGRGRAGATGGRGRG